MCRLQVPTLALSVICAMALSANGADLSGYFKLAGEEGRGFYRVEAFDSPEFVTVLKPTVNAFGSPGLPDKVQQRNSRRKSFGTVLFFSRTPPAANNEFSGGLYEVNCNVPGIPDTFYVASADLRQGISMDPAGFFYPQVGQTIRAFKASGGIMLPSSSLAETSSGAVIGVGPSSVLTMQRDGSITAREIPYDALAADENMFRAVSQLGPFVAYYCAYLARTRPPDAPSKLPEVLASMGSTFGPDSDGSKVFRREGMKPFKVVDTDAFVAVAASGENSPVDQVIVIVKESEVLPLGDIAGILASLGSGGGWQPADANGSSAAWKNSEAGLRASLNDRRNVLLCTKTL